MPGQPHDITTDSAEDSLISRHIEVPPDTGLGGARLVDYGVDVWVLVTYFHHAAEHDARTVAQAYQVSLEAVHAALAFYDRHRDIIDAVIKVNLDFAA